MFEVVCRLLDWRGSAVTVSKNEEGKERGNTREGEGDEMEMIDGVYMKCIGFVC